MAEKNDTTERANGKGQHAPDAYELAARRQIEALERAIVDLRDPDPATRAEARTEIQRVTDRRVDERAREMVWLLDVTKEKPHVATVDWLLSVLPSFLPPDAKIRRDVVTEAVHHWPRKLPGRKKAIHAFAAMFGCDSKSIDVRLREQRQKIAEDRKRAAGIDGDDE